MKIYGISNTTKNNTVTYKPRQTNNLILNDYRLRNLSSDTITFSAKIPAITTPTVEDLVNRTRAVDILRFNVLRLAKYKIPCPVCGHIMLDVDSFNRFESKVLKTTDPGRLIKYIGEYKQYLHPIESKIFSMMKSLHHDYPDMTLLEMLKKKLPKAETAIVHEQSQIFTNIGLMSRDLPDAERIAVQDLINETYARILDPQETSRFSRRIFINKLKNIFVPEWKRTQKTDEIPALYSLDALKIIEEATKLPMAYNNEKAFIVKYAKRNYKDANPDQKLALRMLSNSVATIEHIKPQKRNGGTSPNNISLECACDNNRRGHDSIIEQVAENPQMITNFPRYIKKLCEVHNNGKVEKAYIKQQNKAYKDASYGILNADEEITRLHWERPKRLRLKSGYTPTIEERRANKKLKLKKKYAKAKIIKMNRKNRNNRAKRR